ncbi:MAG: zinc ribbon domain-containing protein [Candidatus Tectomicrobia bacterium]|uniref:Zinc ribbon domain-containing protein n=1 Tax=Tectimicrobiota bacterium TaxID=2528274 RepID=A0A933GN69_UNCTE|nr:zinc ribbon domain-containing protein [Candidatus Tectomicrobia bacterium]
MPIYEYECSQCHFIFERFQKLGESGENLTCPQCQTPKPARIISQVGSTGWADFLDRMERVSKGEERFKP